MSHPGVLAVEGAKRDYDWGSTSAIEDMLGLPRDGKPLAELWFGAHPDDPARVPSLGTTLDALLASDPAGLLGESTAQRFGGQLPFLLKVLAAERPLSVQVHPTLEQARAGFAAEDSAAVPRDAAHRSYRDVNHKPELICALTEFEALCGFREQEDILSVIAGFDLPELDDLSATLRGPDPLRSAFAQLLSLEDPAPLATALATRALAIGGTIAPKNLRGAARAVRLAARHFPGDVGIPISLLLNYVVLEPGEAIYLAPGNVHAYLLGVGIEIMATSDNVLRCGLTPKHINVENVLAVADFAPLREPRWRPDHAGDFRVPVADFCLNEINLDDYRKPGRDCGSCATGTAGLPYLVLCVDGAARVTVGEHSVDLTPGHAAFVPARESLFTLDGRGTVFTATVGQF